MENGEKITIIVAEPWDFKSSLGDNALSGTICDRTVSKYGDAYLLKSDESIDIKSAKVQYMVMMHRNKEISPNSFNVAYIPDDFVPQFHSLDDIMGELIFIIIGSVE